MQKIHATANYFYNYKSLYFPKHIVSAQSHVIPRVCHVRCNSVVGLQGFCSIISLTMVILCIYRGFSLK